MITLKHKFYDECRGEKCSICKKQAMHKVGEESLGHVESFSHNLTAYICCTCFGYLMNTKCIVSGVTE